MRCAPVRCTPIKYMSIRCTPLRCMPIRYRPVRAYEMNAYDGYSYEIYVREMHAREMHAREAHAHEKYCDGVALTHVVDSTSVVVRADGCGLRRWLRLLRRTLPLRKRRAGLRHVFRRADAAIFLQHTHMHRGVSTCLVCTMSVRGCLLVLF
jgi:hypothetical protein